MYVCTHNIKIVIFFFCVTLIDSIVTFLEYSPEKVKLNIY